MTNRDNGSILVWHNGTTASTKIISANLINPWSLFVTTSNDIYVDNGYSKGRVDRWTLNTTNSVTVMTVNSSCTGLFMDTYNSLYYSLSDKHRVFKVGLINNTNDSITVAGTSCPGPVSNMLDHPHGIFVDNNLNLYVADTQNNRVQRFALGESNAMTVAGFGATITFILNQPTGIVLDADDNLFIVDSHNHRIIRSIANDFQCLVGCSGESGTSATHLHNPQTMSFDAIGNIFVTDSNNHRIQKFNLIQNSCGMYIYLKLEYIWYYKKV
jgi:sugar lactone lactonase YvrE